MMGDVVNIGSRLQNLAGPGEILVSEEVYKEVRTAFPNARERELELKGISEPVRVYSLN
jgi:adenylate cyclase